MRSPRVEEIHDINEHALQKPLALHDGVPSGNADLAAQVVVPLQLLLLGELLVGSNGATLALQLRRKVMMFQLLIRRYGALVRVLLRAGDPLLG